MIFSLNLFLFLQVQPEGPWQVEIRPELVHTKFHMKKGSALTPGTDIFPEDSRTRQIVPGLTLLARKNYGDYQIQSKLFWVESAGEAELPSSQSWWWGGADISRMETDATFLSARLDCSRWWRFRDNFEVSAGGQLDWHRFSARISTDFGPGSLRLTGVGLSPQIKGRWLISPTQDFQLSYSGFRMNSPLGGTHINQPYSGELTYNWKMKSSTLRAGLLLNHYHLERNLGIAAEDFVHIRLRTFFIGWEVPF